LAFPGADGTRGLGVFLRASASPPDRNLIDLYADGGFNLAGFFATRPSDKIGVGFSYAHISSRARALDLDYQAFGISPRPARNYEALISLNYLAEIRKGWSVYPTLQYILRPGAGYVLDGGTPRVVGNAVVAGVRTVLKF
jgi:porin